MIELRWLITPTFDGPIKILQYRQKVDIVDYSRKDNNGTFLKTTEMTEWITVPELDEAWNADI